MRCFFQGWFWIGRFEAARTLCTALRQLDCVAAGEVPCVVATLLVLLKSLPNSLVQLFGALALARTFPQVLAFAFALALGLRAVLLQAF